MRRIAGLLCVLMMAATAGCTTLQYASAWKDVKSATCVVSPTPGNAVSGTVTFKDTEDGLLVVAEISGLTPNQKHGFHVHQLGYSGSSDATCTKGHYDPDETGFHALPGFDGANPVNGLCYSRAPCFRHGRGGLCGRHLPGSFSWTRLCLKTRKMGTCSPNPYPPGGSFEKLQQTF